VHGPERELARACLLGKRTWYRSRISREIEGRRRGEARVVFSRETSRTRELSPFAFLRSFARRETGARKGNAISVLFAIAQLAGSDVTRLGRSSSASRRKNLRVMRRRIIPARRMKLVKSGIARAMLRFTPLRFISSLPHAGSARVRWMLVCSPCARKLFGCSPLESSRTLARSRARLKLHRGAQCMPDYVHLCRQQFAALFRISRTSTLFGTREERTRTLQDRRTMMHR